MKAWYAKEAAVLKSWGSDERSYQLLAGYMHLLQKGNPWTIYKLHYTGGGLVVKQFKYLFFALRASIAGIKFMRKVVLVDGTVKKAKFKGVLIAASMQDANFQVFRIAFAIVDSENELAWTWSMVVPDAEDLVMVSDRHRSIYAAVATVYPQAFHCAAYLDAIPLEHWTQAQCKARRYYVMSRNIVEAVNDAVGKFLKLPIVSMVESIRTKLMGWFCIRRAKAERLVSFPDPITPNVNKLMLRYQKDSVGLPVKGVSKWTFQVGSGKKMYYVDLENKTCTCQQFQKLEIPSSHALAAARTHGVNVPSLVGSQFTVTVFPDSYEKFIYPVPNQSDEEVPTKLQETEVLAPENPNGPGRRCKKRIPSTREFSVPAAKKRKRGPSKCSIYSKQDITE
ncbi:PREDICTED: uncharacterized protein LOC104783569 [Camelina sativa]|uniref:Uncharacterized protein LOC104783569 n=1 Tax=Camelina sativa TaxID=90675 RepID=A0ABM0YWR3_CAMSA|nr:PREDICTED: uncharacterized protein LOC104783569 [Camelina sativa]